ncbi:ABC transporter ATP-binding protein [candidate division KSB1 bacterium]
MIEIKELTKYYGIKKAVDNISFNVERGEILGFLGPNAAGKTTTMRVITGYLPATSGTAAIDGFDVFENQMEVKKRIGYLPENPPLYMEMTVLSYLKFVAKIKGIQVKEVKSKIDRVLDICSIDNVSQRVIGKLSKGYKQRVGLAQALIHEPEVLILDEPTSGLDPIQINEVRELIKNIAHDNTVILSTHILPEASKMCHRIIIINEGQLIAVDTPENLRNRMSNASQLQLKVEGPANEIIEKVMGITGVSDVKFDGDENKFLVESELNRDIRKDLSKAIVDNNWGLLEIRPVDISLEEIFLKLTTKEEEV